MVAGERTLTVQNNARTPVAGTSTALPGKLPLQLARLEISGSAVVSVHAGAPVRAETVTLCSSCRVEGEDVEVEARHLRLDAGSKVTGGQSVRMHDASYATTPGSRPTCAPAWVLANYTFSMSTLYSGIENTKTAVTDGDPNTGAMTNSGTQWIMASFARPVTLNALKVAGTSK